MSSTNRSDRAGPVLAIGGTDYPVLIRRHGRARSLSLRADPASRAIRLTIPPRFPEREAMAFVHERRDWLAAQFAKAGAPLAFGAGATIPFRGAELRIDWDRALPRRVVAGEGAIRLGGPVEQVDARVLRWLKTEALALFRADAERIGAAVRAIEPGAAVPAKILLSNARRRWGSCAADGTLRLNWRLAMAPDAVRTSVVAHEIAHLRHMNHSPAFYAWLDRIDPGDRRAADRWLRAHGSRIQSAARG